MDFFLGGVGLGFLQYARKVFDLIRERAGKVRDILREAGLYIWRERYIHTPPFLERERAYDMI
jgi:hypothetical protein